jgi:anti-anti-sigma regulatory factor
VLRITQLSQKGRGLTIKLEGEIVGAWVGAARDACAVRGRRPRPLRLDLAAVTYVDAAGVQLLRDLVAQGAAIAACSSFVGELLRREP